MYLASFPELTEKYPFLRKRGLLAGFLAGLSGQDDERKPSTASKSWVVPASELIDEKIYESESESGLEFIRLNTNLGEWLIYPMFRNTLLDMQIGNKMVRREQFQVITTHNEERKNNPPEAKKLIERLESLKAAGVLTEAEYLQKILEIIAKYSS